MSEPVYRLVADFPMYRVGSDGSVWSLYTRKGAPRGQRIIGTEWNRMKPSLVAGYPHISLMKDGKRHGRHVHALVLRAFVGPCPEGMQCLHGDGNRTNCDLSNLRWGTRKENSADKRLHGTVPLGEKHHGSKLTDEKVLEIRSLASSGLSGRKIAKLYGMHQTTVSDIIRRDIWSHI